MTILAIFTPLVNIYIAKNIGMYKVSLSQNEKKFINFALSSFLIVLIAILKISNGEHHRKKLKSMDCSPLILW